MLKFFDCNAGVGKWKHPTYAAYETAGQLEDILDYTDVDKAVVYHAWSQEMTAQTGNAALMEELAGHPRLLPSWVIFTHYTGEMPAPDLLLDEMLRQGVRVARLLPGLKAYRFSMEEWSAGPLLQALADRRMPMLIDFMFFRRDDPDWKLLYDISHRYPNLPVIITGWAGLASRSFFPLCQSCRSIHLDTSRYSLFRGVEAFCEEVGAQQLVYGSGMPFVAPGVSLTTLTHAWISDEEKQMIAAGNLERMLGEVVL